MNYDNIKMSLNNYDSMKMNLNNYDGIKISLNKQFKQHKIQFK